MASSALPPPLSPPAPPAMPAADPPDLLPQQAAATPPATSWGRSAWDWGVWGATGAWNIARGSVGLAGTVLRGTPGAIRATPGFIGSTLRAAPKAIETYAPPVLETVFEEAVIPLASLAGRTCVWTMGQAVRGIEAAAPHVASYAAPVTNRIGSVATNLTTRARGALSSAANSSPKEIAGRALTLAGRTMQVVAPPVWNYGLAPTLAFGGRTSAHLLAKGVEGLQAAVPYVEPAATRATSLVKATASHATAAAYNSVVEALPSGETVVEELTALQENPRGNLYRVAQRAWENTPWWGKMAATYMLPGGWMTRIPAMGKIVYDALPQAAQEPIQQAANQALVAAGERYPAVRSLTAAVGPLMDQAKEALQHPVVLRGQDINLVRSAARGPALPTAVPLGAISDLAVEIQSYAEAQNIEPSVLPNRSAEPASLVAVQSDIANPPSASAPVSATDALPTSAPAIVSPPASPSLANSTQTVTSTAALPSSTDASSSAPTILPPSLASTAPVTSSASAISSPAAASAAAVPSSASAAVVAAPSFSQVATQAIGTQARVRETDWQEKSNEKIESLQEHLSYFAVLRYMYYTICKMDQKEGVGGRSIHELARVASVPVDGVKPNLWNLFAAEYRLERFSPQWWRCKFFYWGFYKTGIIPKIVGSLKPMMEKERLRLTDRNSGQSRTEFIKEFLDDMSRFFDAMKGASKEYAEAIRPQGDLDDYKRRAISESYGYSLDRIRRDKRLQRTLTKRPEEHSIRELERMGEDFALSNLCTKFSQRLMSDYFTYISFFSETRKIKWIGRPLAFILKPIEWILNGISYVVLRYWVLPLTFKSAVEEGLGAAKRQNLPFTIALTKFCTGLFKSLKMKLADPSDPKPVVPITGSEKLPTVVEKLKTVLDLAPCQTQEAVKAKLQERGGVWDARVQDAIQQGIIKGGHIFLEFLTDPKNREELFYDAVRLLDLVFSESAPKDEAGWKKLADEFAVEQDNLRREARGVFQTIVTEAVKERVDGLRPEKVREIADNSFEQQKQGIQSLIPELAAFSDRMHQKIEANNPDQANSITPDIVACSNRMQRFANQQSAQNEIQDLTPAAKENIDRALSPLYQKARAVMQRYKDLLDLQTKFTAHAQISAHLNLILLQLNAVAHQMKNAPAQLSDLITHLQSSHARIREQLPPTAPEIAELQSFIDQAPPRNAPAGAPKGLAQHFVDFQREQRVVDALLLLDPRGGNAAADPNLGLLFQLAKYELNAGNVPGFQKPQKLIEINRALQVLVENTLDQNEGEQDRNKVREIIKRMQDFGRNSAGKNFNTEIWMPLANCLQTIHRKAIARRDAIKGKIEEHLHQFSHWTQFKNEQYTKYKHNNHDEMVTEIDEARKLLSELNDEAAEVYREAQLHLESGQLKYLTGALGALTGIVFGPAAGAAVGVGAHLAMQNASGLAGTGRANAAATIVGGAALAGAAASALPGVLGIAGGAVAAGAAGNNASEGIVGGISESVVPQVMSIFSAAYDLALSQHAAHAAATWTMQAWINKRPSSAPAPSLAQAAVSSPVEATA